MRQQVLPSERGNQFDLFSLSEYDGLSVEGKSPRKRIKRKKMKKLKDICALCVPLLWALVLSLDLCGCEGAALSPALLSDLKGRCPIADSQIHENAVPKGGKNAGKEPITWLQSVILFWFLLVRIFSTVLILRLSIASYSSSSFIYHDDHFYNCCYHHCPHLRYLQCHHDFCYYYSSQTPKVVLLYNLFNRNLSVCRAHWCIRRTPILSEYIQG